MHTRRLATFLLGAWFTGSLLMAFLAVHNFDGVERILEAPAPQAQQMVQTLGGYWQARSLLRYQVSELNRYYFAHWEWAQVLLGLTLAVTLLFATRGNWLAIGVCVFMLLLVLFQHFFILPDMLWIGRALDFAPDSPWRGHFVRLHVIYSAVEVVKLLLAFGLTTYLFAVRPKPHRRSLDEIDPIDKANHRHVDR